MSKMNPRPTGELRGDDSATPDRGTSTNVGDTYGADTSAEAINREGSAKSSDTERYRDKPESQPK